MVLNFTFDVLERSTSRKLTADAVYITSGMRTTSSSDLLPRAIYPVICGRENCSRGCYGWTLRPLNSVLVSYRWSFVDYTAAYTLLLHVILVDAPNMVVGLKESKADPGKGEIPRSAICSPDTVEVRR